MYSRRAAIVLTLLAGVAAPRLSAQEGLSPVGSRLLRAEAVIHVQRPAAGAPAASVAASGDEAAESGSFVETAALSSIGSILGLVGGVALGYPSENLVTVSLLGLTGSVTGAAVLASRGPNSDSRAWAGSILGSVLGIAVANAFNTSGVAPLLAYSLTHGITTTALASSR